MAAKIDSSTNVAYNKDNDEVPRKDLEIEDDGKPSGKDLGTLGLGSVVPAYPSFRSLDQPSAGYQGRQPPGYQGHQPPGYQGHQQPGYPTVQRSGYPVLQEPGIPIQDGSVTKPPSYFGLSLFSTFCCCMLFGVVAIVNAREVDKAFHRGDYEEAKKRSAAAKKWCIFAIIGGIIAIVIVAVRIVFLMQDVDSNNN